MEIHVVAGSCQNTDRCQRNDGDRQAQSDVKEAASIEKPVDLKPMLEKAGLELVGTTKKDVPVREEAPKPKLGRKRIKRVIQEDSAPLELVQTKKE